MNDINQNKKKIGFIPTPNRGKESSTSNLTKAIPVVAQGFTLVEIMVATSVFLIVIGIISGIFISGIQQQRRALASQSLLDQASYALEYMGRALRMAKKELAVAPPRCLSSCGLNYEISADGRLLRFINHLENDDCQEFYLDSNQLKYRKNILTSSKIFDLTSDKIKITSLNFKLAGASQSDNFQPDNFQPAVTIFLKIEAPGQSREIKIQTTISQRDIDVTY